MYFLVDSAHGHTKNVIDTVRRIKQKFDIQVVAGNVATAEGTRGLIDAVLMRLKWALGRGRSARPRRFRCGCPPSYRDLPICQDCGW